MLRGPWLATVHDVVNLSVINGFVLDQSLCHAVKLVEIFLQQSFAALVITVYEGAYLLINQVRGLLRHHLVLSDGPS